MRAPAVKVEVFLAGGLPRMSIVGLPEAAVRESKDRVRSALITSGFDFPRRRITVNLAPADLPKEGGRFDLPIAVGILAATAQVPQQPLDGLEFIGELALDGQVRRCEGGTAEIHMHVLDNPGLFPDTAIGRLGRMTLIQAG